MGHTVRRVPLGWEHPAHGNPPIYIPLHDGADLEARTAKWDAESKKWDEGYRDNFHGGWTERTGNQIGMSFAEWAGERPNPNAYTPVWSKDEAVGWMMYEDVTEGTPVSPVCTSPTTLAAWLAKYYEHGNNQTYDGWLDTILSPYLRKLYNESRRMSREGVTGYIIDRLGEIYVMLVPKDHPENNELTRKALIRVCEKMLHHLKTGMLIHGFGVMCDDSNNLPISRDSRYPSIHIAVCRHVGDEGWEVRLGPDVTDADFMKVYECR